MYITQNEDTNFIPPITELEAEKFETICMKVYFLYELSDQIYFDKNVTKNNCYTICRCLIYNAFQGYKWWCWGWVGGG